MFESKYGFHISNLLFCDSCRSISPRGLRSLSNSLGLVKIFTLVFDRVSGIRQVPSSRYSCFRHNFGRLTYSQRSIEYSREAFCATGPSQ